MGSKITLGLGVPPGFFLSPKVNIANGSSQWIFYFVSKYICIQIPFFPSYAFPCRTQRQGKTYGCRWFVVCKDMQKDWKSECESCGAAIFAGHC